MLVGPSTARQEDDKPRLDVSATSPYWEWANPRPAEYETEDDITQGGTISPSGLWHIWYEYSALPAASTPAWTKHSLGSPTEELIQSGLRLTIPATNGDYVYYTINVPELDNTIGVLLDTRLRVYGSSNTRNEGACISISDGVYQFMVWLRKDGLNIDGEPNVAIDLTDWNRVQFITRDDTCEVYVNDELQQTGMRMDLTTNKQIAFGSWVPSANVSRTVGRSIATWSWLRVRDLDDYVSLEEFAMALNSVSATYYLYDFTVGDYEIIEWDHSDEEVAEDSTALAIFEGADVLWSTTADGFVVEPLADGTDGEKVRFRVTYLGVKTVLYDEICPREIYGPYSAHVTPFSDESNSGSGYITVTRRGQLSDAAYV